MGIVRGPNIVKNGLILHLDAADARSYVSGSSTWYDLSGMGAHAQSSVLPEYRTDTGSAYLYFDGVSSASFQSVNITQEYRDLFIGMQAIAPPTDPGLRMLFGNYSGTTYLDDSLRFYSFDYQNIYFRVIGTDNNDWQYLETGSMFYDGTFSDGSQNFLMNDVFHIIRTYRSNISGFGTSFRYSISSNFLGRTFMGKLGFILAYNRKLTDEEVLQNYNAFKGRYNLS